MNQECYSQLEILPNEIFIEIFQYFDIRTLFQAFDNLNIRFNNLIRCTENLICNLWNDTYDQVKHYITNVDTLIINSQTNIRLIHFRNIRHLQLKWISGNLIEQINNENLPRLEILIVNAVTHDVENHLYEKIFSNSSPNLQSCYISKYSKLNMNRWSFYLPVLCDLYIGIIDLFAYGAILRHCPNLCSLRFRLSSKERPKISAMNMSLRRMIIMAEDFSPPNNNEIINACLCCVPKLEQLSIYQDFYQIHIPYYMTYDWHAPTINEYLPLLHRFDFYCASWYSIEIDSQLLKVVNQMKNDFQSIHKNEYQSRFHFRFMY